MEEMVLIVDAAASFRRGLAAGLTAAGYAVAEAAGLTDLDQASSPQVIVASVDTGTDLSLLAGRGTDASRPRIVALLAAQDSELLVGLLRSGVECVVDRNAPPETITEAVRMSGSQHSVIPAWAASELAARIPSRPRNAQLIGDEEIEWLRLLANGATVAALAERVGYSEREMFRNLNELYARIEVRNRTGALLWAERHGLLTVDINQIPK